MRSMLVIAGACGFALGFFPGVWHGVSLAMALFRGALLCAVCTWMIRFLLIKLFRAYVMQLQLQRQMAEENSEKTKT